MCNGPTTRARSSCTTSRARPRAVPLLALYAYRDEELDTPRALGGARREPAARAACAPRAARAAARSPTRRSCSAGHPAKRGAGRAPASRDRRQRVLPHVDAARADAKARSPATRPVSCRCPRRCARGARAARARAGGSAPDARRRGGARPALRLRELVRGDGDVRGRVAARGRRRSCGGVCCARSRSGLYDFSHDKVREVGVPRDRRHAPQALHRAVAETLEQQGEGEPHERDARLAEHYERGQVWKQGRALHGARRAALAEAVRGARRARLVRPRDRAR